MKNQQYDLGAIKNFSALDEVERDIAIEVFKTGKETKVKFLEGIRLIRDKGMDSIEAMKESGFDEAYKKELLAKRQHEKAPDTEPSQKDSSGA